MLDCIAVGKKIQEYRLKNHYNQEQLAELLYVSRQAVSRWDWDWQFSPEERMQVLSSIKRKGDTIDVALFNRLSTAEQAFMRNNMNFVRKKKNMVFISESEGTYE